jgi:DNA-binding SARP family transcriptional activator
MGRKRTESSVFEEKIAVRTISGLSIMYKGSPIKVIWESQKARLLFCYLLVTYDQWVHRDKLIALLWPGCESGAGVNNFKTTISRLRKSFSGPRSFNPVITQGEAVRLNIDCIALDASEFRQKSLAGIKLLIRGETKNARSLLEDAQDLYCGTFLPEEPANKLISNMRSEFAVLHASVLDSLEKIYIQEGNQNAIEFIGFLRKGSCTELA